MDVIKLDCNQFVSSVQQILFNYLGEGREWVARVVWRVFLAVCACVCTLARARYNELG